ncbi:hypothetical protein D3C81_1397280 [compost metagenome]
MRDVLAGGGAAGEGHALDQRMAGQRIADQRALARQHADQAARQAGFVADARQGQGRERGDLRRLDHHGVAGGQGRSELLRLGGDRRVPGGDGGHHAHRLVNAHGDEVAARRGDGFLQGLAGGGEELEGGGGAGHQVAGFLDRLAVVQALQLRQLFAALADQRGDAVEHGGALVGLALGPAAFAEGAVGALDGFFDVVQAGGVQAGDGFTGGRIEALVEVAAAQAPLAGDADGLDRVQVYHGSRP